MKLSDCKVDPAKLDGGIWWNFKTETTCHGNEPHETDPCFLIIPAISGRLAVKLAEEQLPHMETLRAANPDDPEEAEEHEANKRAIVRRTRAAALDATTLRSWVNLEDDDGETLEPSQENRTKMLHDRRYLVVHDFIERAAMNRDAALAREEAKAQGN